MHTPLNPYTPILLTYNSSTFYGRKKEITNILQVITAPEPNGHAIYGLRTMGKTTLFKYLRDPNGARRHYEEVIHPDYRFGDKRLLFVYINFHDFIQGQMVFREMLEHLLEALYDEALDSLAIEPRQNQAASKQELCNTIKSILNQLEAEGVRVVYLFDDFDVALDHITPDDDRLLRSLTDFAPLIIATESPISELRPDIGMDSPLIGILRPEGIVALEEDSARLLVQEPAREANQPFAPDEVNLILEVGGKQPFLLIAACELYFNMRQEHPTLSQLLATPQEREQFKRRFILRLGQTPHVENVFSIMWNKIKAEEQEVLKVITQGTPVDDSESPHRTVAGKLANKGLLYTNMYGHYSVFSPVFTEFIKHKTFPVTGGMLTGINPFNALNISDDKLTPIDKAVLGYLLEHANQTCKFEDILHSVWNDTDGERTSKRALEAAVYRLRNTLGDQPAIENVRGVGYKLVTT